MSTIRIQRRLRTTPPAVPTASVSVQPPHEVPREDREPRKTNWMRLLPLLIALTSVALFFLPVIEQAGQTSYDDVNVKPLHGGTGANALVLHFG